VPQAGDPPVGVDDRHRVVAGLEGVQRTARQGVEARALGAQAPGDLDASALAAERGGGAGLRRDGEKERGLAAEAARIDRVPGQRRAGQLPGLRAEYQAVVLGRAADARGPRLLLAERRLG